MGKDKIAIDEKDQEETLLYLADRLRFAAVEALVDRLIPPDPQTPGGKDCGCAVFIDAPP